jgi:hypothetical protein
MACRPERGISGCQLPRKLELVGFSAVHQSGSHIICRIERNGRHTGPIPDHRAENGLAGQHLTKIAFHLQISRDELQRVIKL